MCMDFIIDNILLLCIFLLSNKIVGLQGILEELAELKIKFKTKTGNADFEKTILVLIYFKIVINYSNVACLQME